MTPSASICKHCNLHGTPAMVTSTGDHHASDCPRYAASKASEKRSKVLAIDGIENATQGTSQSQSLLSMIFPWCKSCSAQGDVERVTIDEIGSPKRVYDVLNDDAVDENLSGTTEPKASLGG